MRRVSRGAIVVQGNVLALALPDESVDLVITSPPYFALRSYRDADEHYEGQIGSEPTPKDFLDALIAATKEMMRVLKPSGSIWVNLGDKYVGGGGYAADAPSNVANRKRPVGSSIPSPKVRTLVKPKSLLGLPWRYAIRCIDELGLILRAEVVWSKPNGLPESVTDRVRRSHEQWFHMVKEPRYFAAMDEIREPHAPWTLKAYEYEQANHYNRKKNADRVDEGDARDYAVANPLGKLPGSVWSIPSEPLLIPEWAKTKYDLPDHFAAFPTEWPRRIILGFSPSGICVECGEGRRPVVDKQAKGRKEDPTNWSESHSYHEPVLGRPLAQQGFQRGVTATITGYACACPEPTAETRPSMILDPFGGTGTVALVARALGRIGISVDLSHDYCKLAKWRIFESGHGVKSMAKSQAERQASFR